MEAIIRIRPEELTDEFFKQLKLMASSSRRIKIKLEEVGASNNLSENEIDERLKLFGDGNAISFTMEELDSHVRKMVK